MSGITCPACGDVSRSILESRRARDRVRRRCECTGCGERFTTWEIRADRFAPSTSPAVTCEQCMHWDGRCGMGFPDPAEEGIAFAAECSTFAEASR